jgi:asparagine synthase (glutamine-hydrolysing)
MCGIAGIWTPDRRVDIPDLQRMARAISHRGPDESGFWVDDAVGIGFAHQRLSIVDLSNAGHQPMHSHDGRWVISYNGEVYNFQTLRAELEAQGPVQWRGHSDTEVLIECIAQWGVETTLKRINGMFALALWDRQERKLYLARDRMGEKPLYIAFLDQGIAFASELKAFIQLRQYKAEINRQAVAQLLKYNYIPSPSAIYKDTFKLAPSHYVLIDADFAKRRPSSNAFVQKCSSYWSLPDVARDGLANPFAGHGEAFAEALESSLRKAIAQRLVADVPVGAFLSGGVDSSLVVSLMQQLSPTPIRTFTIGFSESLYDESTYAQAVSTHLGTDHCTVRFSAQDALERIPTLGRIYDEPLADASQLPTVMLAEITRPHVKVSLSGDGADELFAGYPRYAAALRHWQAYRKIPAPIRSATSSALIYTGRISGLGLSRRLQRFGRSISRSAACGVYRSLVETWPFPEELLIGIEDERTNRLEERIELADQADAHMLLIDQLGYLPDNLMVKTDRASMASSLEARMPYLDPELIALAWRLPLQSKLQGSKGKIPLRQLLSKYLPRELVERPKAGFNAPIGEWIKAPLRDWAEDLLSADRLQREGFFRSEKVRAIWKRHLAGRDESQALWTVLTFQSWLSQRECNLIRDADVQETNTPSFP